MTDAAARLKRFYPSRSASVRSMLRVAAKVVDHPVNVIVTGETGSGKDYLAEVLHRAGPRRVRPFLHVDCAAIPPELFESELFGYEPGAFTDAKQRKRGKFEEASGGTAYLDEINALAPHVQAKLLRAIQEKQFQRLGGAAVISFDLRFITSSTLTMEQLARGDVVRSDLFFRLNVVSIAVPPLRERREDIPMLARAYLAAMEPRVQIAAETMKLLQDYAWPGNIRQLRNVLARCVIISRGGVVTPDDLPADIFHTGNETVERAARERWSLEELEKTYIARIIAETGENYSEAARVLGISRKTLLEKRKKYEL